VFGDLRAGQIIDDHRWRTLAAGPAVIAGSLLALAGATLARAPMAQANHDSATRICELGDTGTDYVDPESRPIRNNSGKRLGRLVFTYRPLGGRTFKVCAVALRKRHRRERHMKIQIGFNGWPPRKYHKDSGRFRRYAGPVYLGGTYRRYGGRYIIVQAWIARTGYRLFFTPVPS
jgi:hypothetical protein